jgi:hypothetical protein
MGSQGNENLKPFQPKFQLEERLEEPLEALIIIILE